MFPKPKSVLLPNTYAFESEPMVKATGFREYDARWLFNKEINLMGVQALGMGLGALIAELGMKQEIVTGHDFRGYSASIKYALISGLMAAGCKVHDIGLAVTPMAYFAQFDLDVPCVAMVTASHNDNGWTGVKMGANRPLTFGPDEMTRLKEIVLSAEFKNKTGGSYQFHENFPARYIADLTNRPKLTQIYAGIQQWSAKKFGSATWPVVAETWSGYLSDIEGFHVSAETAMAALDAAKPGAVEEGNVGGGTGMVCFGFKGGIGTASRVVSAGGKSYTVGVLVQCNTGDRKVLRIGGVPVGAALDQRWLPCFDPKLGRGGSGPLKACTPGGVAGEPPPDQGSIIIVVGTDAQLSPLQLNRVARRAAMGLARLGSYSGNSSGDLIVSFSTQPAEVDSEDQDKPTTITPIPNAAINPIFEATVQATEEAIVNALVAARTMTGINGATYFGLPHDELGALLKRYNRLEEPQR